jgi:hypothetical protein
VSVEVNFYCLLLHQIVSLIHVLRSALSLLILRFIFVLIFLILPILVLKENKIINIEDISLHCLFEYCFHRLLSTRLLIAVASSRSAVNILQNFTAPTVEASFEIRLCLL